MTKKEKFVLWLNKFNRAFNKITICFLYVFLMTILGVIIYGANQQKTSSNVSVTYSRPSYTVTFDPAGGGVSPSQKTVKLGENYGDLPVPTRAGYVFYGWRNAANEYVTSDTQYIIVGNEKLTAHWRQPISYLSSDWKTRIENATTPTSANLSGRSKGDYVLTAETEPVSSEPYVTVTFTSDISAAAGLSNSLSIGTNDELSTDAFSSDEYFYDVTAYFDNEKKNIVIYSPYTIYAPANSRGLFFYCSNMTSITLGNLNTSKVTTMERMFKDCSKLTSLDVGNFDTSNVTDMNDMFDGCSKLTSLDVKNFNTSNVTDMSGMFGWCSSVTAIDVSNFDTSNVTTMSGMFDSCTKLVTADISGFNVSNCTGFLSMFQDCVAYKTAILPEGIVETGSEMYSGCSSLSSVTLPTTCTTIVQSTFESTTSLKSIDLKNVKTIYERAFYGGGLAGTLTCPANRIAEAAFASNNLSAVTFTHTTTIVIVKEAFSANPSLTTLDFLAQGDNFKSNSFGENIWQGCQIQYVKVTQGNFGKELMAETQILRLGDVETTSSYTYIYVPGYVSVWYRVGCYAWSWTAVTEVTIQSGGGTTKSFDRISVSGGWWSENGKTATSTEQASALPAKYGSLGVKVYNSCTKGNSTVKVTIYGIGSLDSTEWNKIVASGYNFRCNSTSYRPSAHTSIASNMNDYCYPNYLDYWICQY